MKQLHLFFLMLIATTTVAQAQKAIRINQIGYLLRAPKFAVYTNSEIEKKQHEYFEIKDALTDKTVIKSTNFIVHGEYYGLKTTYRLDFSDLKTPGAYYIKIGDTQSEIFRVASDVYRSTADFALNFIRMSRSGYNPILNQTCHPNDGYIVGNHSQNNKQIDVTGGWSEGKSYAKYVTTTAQTTISLMFAYEQNPEVFKDQYDAQGKKTPNGIPDVLDEAKWGLDWLIKMNPEKNVMYHQVADDRGDFDFTLPNLDKTKYGNVAGRPVYFCTGKPQGSDKYKNQSDGLANIAGKFAASFAMGAVILKNYYPDFARSLHQKAVDAYLWGQQNPGVCQSVPYTKPQYMQESTWVDDMELAAVRLFILTNNENYLTQALDYARKEPVTPWIAMDSVRHYQYFPFVNIGHFYLGAMREKDFNIELLKNLKAGIGATQRQGQQNAFYHNIPFIQGSNNLAAAMASQIEMYYTLKPGLQYQPTEYSLIDWILGCNPWGKSMVVGLPKHGKYPEDTHSAFSHFYPGNEPWGALVNGPVYKTTFNNHKNTIRHQSETAFNKAVYNDGWTDYLTNQPTLDGTATLVYLFSNYEKKEYDQKKLYDKIVEKDGFMIRGDTTKKNIALVFTAHNKNDGFEFIKSALDSSNIKASFFFTGDFYRNKNNKSIVELLIRNGHCLGLLSDKYTEFVANDATKTTLISFTDFKNDIKANYLAMEKFGLTREKSKYLFAPYYRYNAKIAHFTRQLGLEPVCNTPGTYIECDNTLQFENNYYSNERILNQLNEFEKNNTLNGTILSINMGTDAKRTEKFYKELNILIGSYMTQKYTFVTIDEMLKK